MFIYVSLLILNSLLTVTMETGKAPHVSRGTRAKKNLMLLQPERGWICAFPVGPSGLEKLKSSWAFEALFRSLGHVLSYGLPHFILQVCQFLPIGLQVEPLIVWHLKRRIKGGYFRPMFKSNRMHVLVSDKEQGTNNFRFCLTCKLFLKIFIWYLLINTVRKKAIWQPPIILVVLRKDERGVCNSHHRYTSTLRDWM